MSDPKKSDGLWLLLAPNIVNGLATGLDHLFQVRRVDPPNPFSKAHASQRLRESSPALPRSFQNRHRLYPLFRKLLPYLRKEITTPLIIEVMINSLLLSLIFSSTVSNCQNMSWGWAFARLEALNLHLPKFIKQPSPLMAAYMATQTPPTATKANKTPIGNPLQVLKSEAGGSEEDWKGLIKSF